MPFLQDQPCGAPVGKDYIPRATLKVAIYNEEAVRDVEIEDLQKICEPQSVEIDGRHVVGTLAAGGGVTANAVALCKATNSALLDSSNLS